MAVSSLRTKRWTRVEYERLIDLGAFRPGERLELVGGALLVCEPQGGTLGPPDMVSPLAAPTAAILVADLLP